MGRYFILLNDFVTRYHYTGRIFRFGFRWEDGKRHAVMLLKDIQYLDGKPTRCLRVCMDYPEELGVLIRGNRILFSAAERYSDCICGPIDAEYPIYLDDCKFIQRVRTAC